MDNIAHTLWSILLFGLNPWVILGANLPDLSLWFNNIPKMLGGKGYFNTMKGFIKDFFIGKDKWHFKISKYNEYSNFLTNNSTGSCPNLVYLTNSIPFLILLVIPAILLKNNNYNKLVLAYAFHVFVDIFTHKAKFKLFYPFSERETNLGLISLYPDGKGGLIFFILNYVVLFTLLLIKY